MSNWQNRIVEQTNMNPKDLIPNPSNIKEHGEYQKKVMTGLVEEIGWVQTVVFNRTTGRLIDGHMRVELAIENGEESVPVTVVELPIEDEQKMLLTYDLVGSLSTIRSDHIQQLSKSVELANASARDFANNIAKKNGVDTKKYKDTGDEEEEGDSKEEEFVDEFDVEDGDIFNIINQEDGCVHRLAIGDNTSIDLWNELFEGESPLLCVTSPPYNQKINKFKPSGMQKEAPNFVDRMASSYEDDIPEPEYQEKQIIMINKIIGFLDNNGSLFYNHKVRYRDKKLIHPMEWLSRINYPIRQEIIWDRGISIALNARMFIPIDERIYWIKKNEDFVFRDETEIKAWSTVWKFAARNEVPVSAAFPFELPYRCILACSNQGDRVFDPYSGSGTTIVAAHRTGRIGYGIEIDKVHASKSLYRLKKEGLVIKKNE